MSGLALQLKNVSIAGWIQVAAVLLVSMMGAAVTTLMPLLVGAYTDSGLFTTTQVGWLTSAEVAGILLTSTSAYIWSRKVNWQIVTLLGLSTFIAANWFSMSATEFEYLFILRALAGVACGATYAISIAALGDFPQSDKAFSGLVTIQVVFGTLGFWLLPNIISSEGLGGIFYFFNLCLLPALIFSAVKFPVNSRVTERLTFKIDGSLKAAILIFSGVVAYYFAQGTVWAYLERIGVNAGLSGAEIGSILGLGFAISAVGSLLSGLFVEKVGRNWGLYVTLIIQVPCLLVLFLMNNTNAFWIYAISTIIYQVMWSFVIPIMMGIFNDIDKSGKLIVLCVAAFKVGLTIGPPVAAFVVTVSNVNNVIWLGLGGIALSILLCHLSAKDLQSNER
ncbi:MAG: MFS transporter [Gammaproteobacteria bacterium]|nr:MFS transporter [Gammaproteobacteria bacterium]